MLSWLSFRILWWIAFVVLVLLAAWWGKQVRKDAEHKSAWAILMDGRNRISLNHLQIVMWTTLVAATLLAMFFSGLLEDWQNFDPDSVLDIPPTLLILMGISVGSAATAGAVKSAKDLKSTQPGGTTVAVAGVQIATGKNDASGNPIMREIRPHLLQTVSQEEGPNADQAVDVTKFQHFLFTLVAGLVYIVLTMQSSDYPELGDQVLWLIGISHAGYVAGKLPDRGPVNP